MPYNYFAESFNELDRLTALVEKLQHLEAPLYELKDENYLLTEILRVKASASRDVMIFGVHSGQYLRLHLCLVYDMMITLMEIMRRLPESVLMGDKDIYQLFHCSRLRSELDNLAVFYENLNDLIN